MLLDTSGLFSYLHADENNHLQARQLFDEADVRLTHNYVLAELIPLCRVRGANVTLVIQFATELLDGNAARVVWVDRALHDSAATLLGLRQDRSYSLCDAVSFILMRQNGLFEALTTDRHFEQEGFARLLLP